MARQHLTGINLVLIASCFLALPGTARATLSCSGTSFGPGFSCVWDASNFAILYEGNNGNQIQMSNSWVTGNIGIGVGVGTKTGEFKGSSPGVITGELEFSAANSGGAQYSNSGLTITGNKGAPLYGQTKVETDLQNLNSLSQILGTQSGTTLNITGNSSINASSGKLDAQGNEVFTATLGSSFVSGTKFTINGTANQYVVINIASTTNGFDGQIVLSGGITSDHVIFNLDGGNYSTLTGGSTLTIDNNCSTQSCATAGTFLDPNGDIEINHSVLDGRIFGGDTQTVCIVNGAYIYEPRYTPEPAYYGLSCLALTSLFLYRRKILRSRRDLLPA